MAIAPVPAFPFPRRPFSSITPFTYSDAMTHLELLEKLRVYAGVTLPDEINKVLDEYSVEITAEVQAAIDLMIGTLNDKIIEINDALADQQADYTQKIADLTVYVDDAVQQIINNSIELQDPVMAGIIEDSNSVTGAYVQGTFDRVYTVHSAAELDSAILRCVQEGGGSIKIPVGANIELESRRTLPNEVVRVVIDGTITLMGDTGAFIREGDASATRINVISGATAGSFILSMSDTTDLEVGDSVIILSDARFPSNRDTSNRYGYSRDIISKTPTEVRIDGALPRDLSGDIWLQKVDHANPISIEGTGTIYCDSPEDNRSAMLTFRLTRGVSVSGVTLRDGGGQGVHLVHCVNFNVDTEIDNFIDDLSNGHVGYGVNVAGASRGGRIGGRISSCRHAVTTTTGNPLGNLLDGGEPENIVFEPITAKCYVPIDTHTPGWGITVRANDSGSESLVTVRADNVTVESATSYGLRYGGGIVAAANLDVPPVIGQIKLTNPFQAKAVTAHSPVDLTATPSIYNPMAGFSTFSNASNVRGNGSVTSRSMVDSYTVTNQANPEPIDDLKVTLDRGRYIVRATILYDATQDGYRARLYSSPTWATSRVFMEGIGPDGELKRIGGDSDSALLFGSGEFMKLEIYAQIVLTGRSDVVFMHSQGVASSGNVRTRAGSSIEIVKEQ